MKDLSDHQPALDCGIGVPTRRAVLARPACLVPSRHGRLVKSHRQRPVRSQRHVVNRPILNPIRPLLFVHPPNMGMIPIRATKPFLCYEINYQ